MTQTRRPHLADSRSADDPLHEEAHDLVPPVGFRESGLSESVTQQRPVRAAISPLDPRSTRPSPEKCDRKPKPQDPSSH